MSFIEILFFYVLFSPFLYFIIFYFYPLYNVWFLRYTSLLVALIHIIFLSIIGYYISVHDVTLSFSFSSIFHLHWIEAITPFTIGAFLLEINKLNVLFLFLTSFLTIVCLLISWNWLPFFFSTRYYIALIFLIEFFCICFFCSMNLLLFYIFFESVLFPMYLLVGIWGLRDRKIHASYQFFMYTFFGSLFMIFAIISTGIFLGTFELSCLELYWWFFVETKYYFFSLFLWLCFFIGFAVKVPMVPFHIWLPEAHVEAPTAGSIILAGVLLKFGTYGFYRILVLLFPYATYFFFRLVVVMSLLAIIYASVVTYVQIDLKKIIAYSSVSHMGYVTLGLVLDNVEGLVGSLFMMITHGFISGALFYIIGILYERYGTRNLFYYGGIKNIMPLYTLVFFFLTLANMNLPLTGGFVAEFLVLLGSSVMQSKSLVFLATFGLVTNGVYCIWLFNRLCMGSNIGEELSNSSIEYKDLDLRELLVLCCFSIFIIILGIWPNGCLFMFEDMVQSAIWYKSHFLYFI